MNASNTKPNVFIDGQQGSTGLRITSLLDGREDLHVVRIDVARRKDPATRRACFEAADVAVLCLPDAASEEALSLMDDLSTRVIDTSSSRRILPGWVYGLPELNAAQRDAIRVGNRVANPGCYPQTFILGVRPLIEAGVLDPSLPFTVNAVSGYSGGGRQMVEQYQAATAGKHGDAAMPFVLYGLAGGHKHLPEMAHYSGADAAPLFVPSVVQSLCGMLVSVPLPAAWLNGSGRDEIAAIWAKRYAGEPFVRPHSPDEADAALREGRFLDLDGANFSNRLDLMVFGDARQGLTLVGRLDNLGKGASGNAVQCLNLMLGLEETAGLSRASRSEAA